MPTLLEKGAVTLGYGNTEKEAPTVKCNVMIWDPTAGVKDEIVLGKEKGGQIQEHNLAPSPPPSYAVHKANAKVKNIVTTK